MWPTAASASEEVIFLDHAAGAPLDARVWEIIQPYFDAAYGNPSALYASGRLAKRALETARQCMAQLLEVTPQEITFTGSGTESDTLAIIGSAMAAQSHGRHILVSAIEHKAVLTAAQQLEHHGFTVERVPVNCEGLVSVADCIARIRPDTALVSVMLANNEIGTVQPVAELAAAIKEHRGASIYPLLHTDACQAAGYLDVRPTKLGVDLLTLNGAKIYGPKGVGVLYHRRGLPLQPVIPGGGQESNLRGGTENLPAIVGFATALELALDQQASETARLTPLRDWFMGELQNRIPGLVINGHTIARLPNNVHCSIPYVEGESIVLHLDQHHIAAATGSACSTHDTTPSHVLLAIDQHPELLHGSLRFTMGRTTARAQLERVLTVLPGIVQNLSRISALTTSRA